MLLKENNRITLHPLHFSNTPVENNQYAVVRWDTDDSVLVGREAYGVLRFLQKPRTVREIITETDVGTKEVISFLHQMIDLNFIKEIDGELIRDNGTKIHPWKLPFDRKYLQFLVNSAFTVALLLFILSGMIIGFLMPGYIPSYKDFFWTDDFLLVIISMFFISNIELFFHEIGHLIVTYAIGGVATMRLSTRFVYLVAETESYHLAMVPKSKRYYVYLAGLVVDFTIIAFCYWLIYLLDTFAPGFTGLKLFLKANIVALVSGIIWQYNIFLETDMYNMISEYFKIDFLKQEALVFILHKVHRVTIFSKWIHHKITSYISRYKQSAWQGVVTPLTRKQKKLLIFYIFFLITGLLSIVFNTVFFQLPREFIIVRGSVINVISAARRENFGEAMKSVIVILLILYDYILIAITKIREQKLHQRTSR